LVYASLFFSFSACDLSFAVCLAALALSLAVCASVAILSLAASV
jgi:hypothetical protein